MNEEKGYQRRLIPSLLTALHEIKEDVDKFKKEMIDKHKSQSQLFAHSKFVGDLEKRINAIEKEIKGSIPNQFAEKIVERLESLEKYRDEKEDRDERIRRAVSTLLLSTQKIKFSLNGFRRAILKRVIVIEKKMEPILKGITWKTDVNNDLDNNNNDLGITYKESVNVTNKGKSKKDIDVGQYTYIGEVNKPYKIVIAEYGGSDILFMGGRGFVGVDKGEVELLKKDLVKEGGHRALLIPGNFTVVDLRKGE